MKKAWTPLKTAVGIFALTLALLALKPLIGDLMSDSLARHFRVPAKKISHTSSFEIDFGIPVWGAGTGLDFRVHDYIARNFGATEQAYSVPIVYQRESYGSPPLMPLFFGWVRFFSSDTATLLWMLIVFLGILGLTLFWLKQGQMFALRPDLDLNGPALFMVALLFMFSYPALFSFERGGTDIPVLALYSLGAIFLGRRFWAGLGAISVVAALLKIYPVFPALALSITATTLCVIGFFQKKDELKKAGFYILLGQALTTLVLILPFFNIYRFYVEHVLRSIHQDVVLEANAHTIPYFFGKAGWIFWGVLYFAGTVSMFFRLNDFAASLKNEKGFLYEALFSYAYVLALTIYVSPTSYDYNLILLIPLLALCISSLPTRQTFLMNASFGILLAAFCAPRWIHLIFLDQKSSASIYTSMQMVGLLLLGCVQVFKMWGDLFCGNSKKR